MKKFLIKLAQICVILKAGLHVSNASEKETQNLYQVFNQASIDIIFKQKGNKTLAFKWVNFPKGNLLEIHSDKDKKSILIDKKIHALVRNTWTKIDIALYLEQEKLRDGFYSAPRDSLQFSVSKKQKLKNYNLLLPLEVSDPTSITKYFNGKIGPNDREQDPFEDRFDYAKSYISSEYNLIFLQEIFNIILNSNGKPKNP